MITVQGQAVTAEHIDQLTDFMRDKRNFSSKQLTDKAATLGYPETDGTAMRVADRVIQMMRKKGLIKLGMHRDWYWAGETKAQQQASAGNCGICGRPLNLKDDPTSLDCGGDCLRCMAEAGDPDCVLPSGVPS